MTDIAYDINQVRSFEKELIDDKTVGLDLILEKASHALFKVCQEKIKTTDSVLIVCGKGGNATDAMKLAILMKKAGYKVEFQLCYDIDQCNEHLKKYHKEAKKEGVEQKIGGDYQKIDHIVDGIFGAGYKERGKNQCASIIDCINQSGANIISIDVPSGLNADTGVAGSHVVRAHLTITLLMRKRGLYTNDAFDCVGDLLFDDLGFSPKNIVD